MSDRNQKLYPADRTYYAKVKSKGGIMLVG